MCFVKLLIEDVGCNYKFSMKNSQYNLLIIINILKYETKNIYSIFKIDNFLKKKIIKFVLTTNKMCKMYYIHIYKYQKWST